VRGRKTKGGEDPPSRLKKIRIKKMQVEHRWKGQEKRFGRMPTEGEVKYGLGKVKQGGTYGEKGPLKKGEKGKPTEVHRTGGALS